MTDELCGVEFRSPSGLRAGSRTVACALPAGHDGDHVEWFVVFGGDVRQWSDPLPRRVPRAALDPQEYLDPEVTKLVREVLDADPTELVLAAAQRVVAERDELRRDRDATRAEWADLHAVAADAIAERDRLRAEVERLTGKYRLAVVQRDALQDELETVEAERDAVHVEAADLRAQLKTGPCLVECPIGFGDDGNHVCGKAEGHPYAPDGHDDRYWHRCQCGVTYNFAPDPPPKGDTS